MKAALLSFLLTLLAFALGFSLRRPSAEPLQARIPAVDPASKEAPSVPPVPAVVLTPAADKASAIAALEERARNIVAEERGSARDPFLWWRVLCELAEQDPEAAIRALRAAPKNYDGKPYRQNGTVDSIVAWWCAKDPAAALAWYWNDMNTRDPKPRPDPEIIQTLARKDPAAAARFIVRHLPVYAWANFGYSGHSDGMTSAMMGPAFRALEPWIRSLEDIEALAPRAADVPGKDVAAEYWQGLTDLALSALGAENARVFLDRHPLPAPWPDGLLHPLTVLAEKGIATTGGDPTEWIEWGRSHLPQTPELQKQFASRAVSAWAKADPEAAGEWLRGEVETDPASAPAAIRAYATAVLDEAPAAAMEWITAIPEETARRQNMILHFPAWAEKDPAAARTWLEAAPWPAEIKTLLNKGAFR